MSNDLVIRMIRRGGWFGSLSGLLCSAEAVLDLSSTKLSIGEGIHILGQSFPVLAVAAIMGAVVGIGWGRFVAHGLNRIMQSLSEDSSYQILRKRIWTRLLFLSGAFLIGSFGIAVAMPQNVAQEVFRALLFISCLPFTFENDIKAWYQKHSLPPPS